MLPPLPRCSSWVYSSLISPSRISLPRKGSPGRPAHRPFRGLLGVHSRCGLHTRAVTVIRDPLSEGFRHFVSSMPAPLPAGANRRVGLAPTGKRRLVTAHPLCRHWLELQSSKSPWGGSGRSDSLTNGARDLVVGHSIGVGNGATRSRSPGFLLKVSFADRVPRQMPQGQSRRTLKSRGS